MTDRAPTQHVVLYDKPGETAVVYDTCYTEAQRQATILRCVNDHGRGANVRAELASTRAKMGGRQG